MHLIQVLCDDNVAHRLLTHLGQPRLSSLFRGLVAALLALPFLSNFRFRSADTGSSGSPSRRSRRSLPSAASITGGIVNGVPAPTAASTAIQAYRPR